MPSPMFPPGLGPDPSAGQPPQISGPPPDPNLMGGPVNQSQGADEMYQASYGQGPQRPISEQERSAMMYLEAAQKTLSAAADELPALSPAIQQAGQILSLGIQNLLSAGQGFPVNQPPQPPQGMTPPMPGMPGMDETESIPGGGIRGAGVGNIPIPGLI